MFKKLTGWLTRSFRRLVQRLDALAVTAEVRDGQTGWQAITRAGTGPADRPWYDQLQDLTDALEAWRVNAWVRQVVRLTTAYVVGDGVSISSAIPEVQDFISRFWSHPENLMDQRLASLCDELTRAGELFPVLFTNKFDGMSQFRVVPASCIEEVVTDLQDYEKELEYREIIPGQLDRKTWKSKRTARIASQRPDGRGRRPEPMMLHYPINRVIGATRGESDLTPLLPWARRYTDWLKERVLFNRIRNKLAIVWVKIKDTSQVQAKQKQYDERPPEEGAVLVTGPDEEITFPAANIQSFDVSQDGKAIKLAMAAAANLSLIHFGEGDTALKSTSASMDDRTFRTNRQRQQDFGWILCDICACAYRRYRAVLGSPVDEYEDLKITAQFPDISRGDNRDLAEAARSAVSGLTELQEALRIDTPEYRIFAFRLALKFAGEILPDDEIEKLLGTPATASAGEKSPNGRESNGRVTNYNGTSLYPAAPGAAAINGHVRKEEAS